MFGTLDSLIIAPLIGLIRKQVGSYTFTSQSHFYSFELQRTHKYLIDKIALSAESIKTYLLFFEFQQ